MEEQLSSNAMITSTHMHAASKRTAIVMLSHPPYEKVIDSRYSMNPDRSSIRGWFGKADDPRQVVQNDFEDEADHLFDSFNNKRKAQNGDCWVSRGRSTPMR
jgi:hypothetical protein